MPSSSSSDPTQTALAHLSSMSSVHPDLASVYDNLSSLYSRKLWHQLTVASLDFLSSPQTTLRTTPDGQSSHLAYLQKVVLPIDKKLNPLSLARMAALVAFSLPDGTDVLTSLLEQKERLGPSAALYLESRLGLLKLSLLARQGANLTVEPSLSMLDDIQTTIERNRPVLQQLADTESEAAIVHSSFYETAMTYRKAVGPPEGYYKEAIQYVAYTNLSELSQGDRYNLAIDLSLSALTGEGVFNFGEVVTSGAPILKALEGTEMGYLVKLLECGSRGDVIGFQAVADANREAIARQPSLVSRAEAVKEKITLLALVNMVFERPSLERTLLFEDIADRVGVPLEQVEWVIMRALSLKLIEGTMDQVEQTVDVTWVMPRVLNAMQMEELASRFGEWAVKVSKTRDYMLEHTGALLNQ
ncbi:hypothetical protein HJC23_000476 [Cyclotella cryptica]|uniref:PCI domain-containing protein n=1 Tax=Cyclotella cryptica TaxID=29204 RepID=A0ABD3Q9W0_9STRA|eukprot:CCRYP_007238-RA/>CCRYP_007238-RA protein AED:0.07 eAED:0.07 QI:204/0/0.5/1/0/0/2/0/414